MISYRKRIAGLRNQLTIINTELMALHTILTGEPTTKAPSFSELADAARALRQSRDNAIDTATQAIKCKGGTNERAG